MKIKLLFTLCCVSLLSDDVFAEGEKKIKKGQFPFMAFIYYPDYTLIEETGLRYLRGAVLVKPDWLVSSSIGSVMTNDTPLGFPRKTLLARLGAITIDGNFTLNEDENEQEREIIQIVRPYNYSEAQWWHNDISLLKTLQPFNYSLDVGPATIRKAGGSNNCFMLIFAKISNWTEDRTLTQLSVELLLPSREVCGNHFYETMGCATDTEESKNAVLDPEFCQSNSGGPIVCENEVTGLQTYIENNCKPPYLYQLLSAWDNFITCGIEEKCNEEQCAHMCIVTNKDEEKEAVTEDTTTLKEFKEPSSSVVTVFAIETEEPTTLSQTPEVKTTEQDTTTPPTLTTAVERRITVDTTTRAPTTTTTEMLPLRTSDAQQFDGNVNSSPSPEIKEITDRSRNYEEDDLNIERKANVLAQKHEVKAKNSADRMMYVPLSLLFWFFLAMIVY